MSTFTKASDRPATGKKNLDSIDPSRNKVPNSNVRSKGARNEVASASKSNLEANTLKVRVKNGLDSSSEAVPVPSYQSNPSLIPIFQFPHGKLLTYRLLPKTKNLALMPLAYSIAARFKTIRKRVEVMPTREDHHLKQILCQQVVESCVDTVLLI